MLVHLIKTFIVVAAAGMILVAAMLITGCEGYQPAATINKPLPAAYWRSRLPYGPLYRTHDHE